jgi:tRNA G10  N-methylase Trm11
MDDSIAILGRQPALGTAELESLYGASTVHIVNPQVVHLQVSPCTIDFRRLGGTMKLARLLTELDTTDWKRIEKFLLDVSPSHVEQMPEGKMHLGISTYGFDIQPQQLLATGLRVKKAIQKSSGRSVRLVPNNTTELNAAQVIHNKLTSPTGWELIFVRSGDKTLIAQTIAVQDIDSYSKRDFGRPKRDARVGMLPPKLAQIIINIATGPEEFQAIKDTLSSDVCLSNADKQRMHTVRSSSRLLDPFCGTGVVLQEASIMGYTTYGTDVEPRMIDYSHTNLEWLREQYLSIRPETSLAVGDATSCVWQAPIDIVASEAYLGRPFTATPEPEMLSRTMSDCNLIIKKFLQNIRDQLKPGTRLCLAVPAWQIRPDIFRHLPLVDQISDLGYNQVRFERVQDTDLLYYRPDQIVARELLVITRK